MREIVSVTARVTHNGRFSLHREHGYMYATVTVHCAICRCDHAIQNPLTRKQIEDINAITSQYLETTSADCKS